MLRLRMNPDVLVPPDTDHTIGGRCPDHAMPAREPEFQHLRHQLVVHYNHAKSKGELVWF